MYHSVSNVFCKALIYKNLCHLKILEVDGSGLEDI